MKTIKVNLDMRSTHGNLTGYLGLTERVKLRNSTLHKADRILFALDNTADHVIEAFPERFLGMWPDCIQVAALVDSSSASWRWADYLLISGYLDDEYVYCRVSAEGIDFPFYPNQRSSQSPTAYDCLAAQTDLYAMELHVHKKFLSQV